MYTSTGNNELTPSITEPTESHPAVKTSKNGASKGPDGLGETRVFFVRGNKILSCWKTVLRGLVMPQLQSRRAQAGV